MKTTLQLASCLTIAAATTTLSAHRVAAQTNAVNSGNWSTPATWSAGEPNNTTPAIINGGLTVTIDQFGEETNLLDVGTAADATGTLNITGGDLFVSDPNAAEPNLPSIRIGQAAGSNGTFTMSGGSVFIEGPDADSGFAVGDLMIGDVGNATMTMTGGEIHTNDEIIIGTQNTSTATVNISGGTLETDSAGRSILVGFAGNGTLNVSNTATVRANFDMLVGFIGGSTATINQSGGTIEAGFMFSNFDIPPGPPGPGSTVTINQTGGTYNARIAYVMGRGPGTTTMTHSGGTINALTNNGDMVVSDGPGNTSTYTMSGTAQVNVLHNFFVGAFEGSNGAVHQNGGTITAGDNLFVGRDGNGVFNQNGGTINVTNVFLGDFDSSNGTMTVSGGALNVSGNLNVGAALASNAAPDRVEPNGANGPQGQALDANGTFVVNGTGGDINILGNLMANPADKSPARNGPGQQNDALLRFTLGATGISVIDVGLKADLDGAVIDIDDTAGYFTTNPSATLPLISAAGGFGNVFTITPAEAAGNGKGFTQVAGDASLFMLQIVPRAGGGEMLVAMKGAGGIAGDKDADGDVDGNDLLLIQRGLGTTTNATDFANWRANFGMHSAAAVAAAVPEPSAVVLSLGCVLVMAGVPRRAIA